MKSPFAATRHSVLSRMKSPETPSSVPPQKRVDAIAHDDRRTSAVDPFNDPLWVVVIAMGILFGMLAALMASS
ncbi:MAG TPA: hypothetical protein VFP00_03960 [Burkholderiales bacterium]|nr:hypothetical protein [Burkholderiales bacterium]